MAQHTQRKLTWERLRCCSRRRCSKPDDDPGPSASELERNSLSLERGTGIPEDQAVDFPRDFFSPSSVLNCSSASFNLDLCASLALALTYIPASLCGHWLWNLVVQRSKAEANFELAFEALFRFMKGEQQPEGTS